MAWYSDEEYLFRCDSRDKKRVAASAHKQRSHCGKGGRVRFPSDNLTRKELKAMNGEEKIYRVNEFATQEEYDSFPDDIKKIYDKEIVEKIEARVSWDVFKSWGDRAKRLYIERLREVYQAPNTAIAGMFGLANAYLSLYLRELGMGIGRNNGNARRKWKKEEFERWAYPSKFVGVAVDVVEKNEAVSEAPEAPVSEENDIPVVEEVVDENEVVSEAPETPVSEETVVEEIVEHAEKNEEPANEGFETIASIFEDFLGDTERIHPAVPKSGMMSFECHADDALETLRTLLQNASIKLKVEWEII